MIMAALSLTLSFDANTSVVSAANKTGTQAKSGQQTVSVEGGWTVSDSIKLTPEKKKLFAKAVDGAKCKESYKAVGYLGSQVVAGSVHCFLCRATPLNSTGPAHYVLLYVYQDLSGNSELMNVKDLNMHS